jgi:hypothetical protein
MVVTLEAPLKYKYFLPKPWREAAKTHLFIYKCVSFFSSLVITEQRDDAYWNRTKQILLFSYFSLWQKKKKKSPWNKIPPQMTGLSNF